MSFLRPTFLTNWSRTWLIEVRREEWSSQKNVSCWFLRWVCLKEFYDYLFCQSLAPFRHFAAKIVWNSWVILSAIQWVSGRFFISRFISNLKIERDIKKDNFEFTSTKPNLKCFNVCLKVHIYECLCEKKVHWTSKVCFLMTYAR